ncbi:MAG: AGE family epimerase/isomerase [Pseudomonadota bacterium]
MQRLTAFADWARDAALPFWRARAIDETGAFLEALTPDGAAALGEVRRVRVSFRQLYVFAHAHTLGALDATDFLQHGLERLEDLAWAKSGAPGWAHRLEPDLSIRDGSRDAYDHAFAAMALSWVMQAAPDRQAERLLQETLALLEGPFRHPAGGVRENLDTPTALRRQNPHMHLLEMYLTLYEHTEDRRFLDAGDGIIALFHEHFHEDGRLVEWFADDWSAAPQTERDKLEPGHHVEWVWLLRWRERLGGPPVGDICARLMETAKRGRRPGEIALCDEMQPDGTPTRPTKRLWVQTELLKAEIMQARAGVPGAAEAADAVAGAILDFYLDPAIRGGWIDRIDADMRPDASLIPASTFYHLFHAAMTARDFVRDQSAS